MGRFDDYNPDLREIREELFMLRTRARNSGRSLREQSRFEAERLAARATEEAAARRVRSPWAGQVPGWVGNYWGWVEADPGKDREQR